MYNKIIATVLQRYRVEEDEIPATMVPRGCGYTRRECNARNAISPERSDKVKILDPKNSTS